MDKHLLWQISGSVDKSQWPRDETSSPPLRFRLLISTSLIFCSIAVRD